MEAGKGRATPILSKVEATQALTPEGLKKVGASVLLNEGQTAGAAAILTSSDRYVAVQGYAGVGKTTMFGVVKTLADEGETRSIALARTHRAAEALKSEAGIEARTIASWLVNVERTFARGGEGQDRNDEALCRLTHPGGRGQHDLQRPDAADHRRGRSAEGLRGDLRGRQGPAAIPVGRRALPATPQ